MAGGTAEDFEASKAVMKHLCANFTHMGPSGAGQTTKLINQVLCALHFMAVAEATRLAQDAGVDATRIPQALAASLPPRPFQLLPAGTTVAGWDSHPLRERGFHGALKYCG